MPRFNPFQPGSITPPGMFVGRTQELDRLKGALLQTKFANPKHFCLIGERGIGKSSLLFYLDHVARGTIQAPNSPAYNFVTLTINAEPKDTPNSLVGKVARELRKKLLAMNNAKERFSQIFDFVTRWEVAGVKYKKPSDEDADSIEDLSDALLSFIEASTKTHSGVVLFIDEADNAKASDLGVFCKTLTERASRSEHNRLCLGLAGLPELIEVLRDSHESAPRIFDTLELGTLSQEECDRVINAAINRAKESANETLEFTEDARHAIALISDGYPHFIQQFAFCAVEASNDGVVDLSDFNTGAFGNGSDRKKSAINQLGHKYYATPVLAEMYSSDYRRLLQTMAENLDGWVERPELLKKSKLKETQLNNALTNLKKRKLIVPKQGEKGIYRLPTKSFAIWLKAILANTNSEIEISDA